MAIQEIILPGPSMRRKAHMAKQERSTLNIIYFCEQSNNEQKISTYIIESEIVFFSLLFYSFYSFGLSKQKMRQIYFWEESSTRIATATAVSAATGAGIIHRRSRRLIACVACVARFRCRWALAYKVLLIFPNQSWKLAER